jgi:hypothetical protein
VDRLGPWGIDHLQRLSGIDHSAAFSDLGGTLSIQDNTRLSSVDFSSLTCVNDYTIEGSDLSGDDQYERLVQITSGC